MDNKNKLTAQINKTPHLLKEYIHGLESAYGNVALIVRENVLLKETAKSLVETFKGLPDDEGIVSLLSLVCIDVGPEVVRYWTPEMKEEAVEWASCAHLYASDNLDVAVPKTPMFIEEIKDRVKEATK